MSTARLAAVAGATVVALYTRDAADADPPASLPFGYFSNVLMNLPASALTFLDSFVGAFDRASWTVPPSRVGPPC